MELTAPSTVGEFAEAYGALYASGSPIRVVGGDSKSRFAGPIDEEAELLSTRNLTEVEEYSPGDLSIRVQAGMPYKTLSALLAEQGQMLPFDPPYQDDATIGGVVASNLCGPRRRGYGSARDYVIGVQFVDHLGRLVQSGAMVTKNVAGYDLNKLFVGSWGTLGPMVTVNLRVSPIERYNHTFAIYGLNPIQLGEMRNNLLRGVAAPVAIDYANAASADKMRLDGPVLLARFACIPEVMEHVRTDLAQAGTPLPTDTLDEEKTFYVWQRVREWLQTRAAGNLDGVVLQISSQNTKVFFDAAAAGGLVVARAASGVVYAAYRDSDTAFEALQFLEAQGRKAVVLQAPPQVRASRKLWVGQQSDVSLMRKLKRHFDPHTVVNRGRLYGCI